MPIKICKWCGKEFAARSVRGNYCHGPCYRAKERSYSRQHRTTFSTERRRAADLTQRAIEKGRLIRQSCEECGKPYTVAHHDDYAEPLDIRWLCRNHHMQWHKKFGPGLNAFREVAA